MFPIGDDADLIVRMFRLRPPSTISICIIFAILGLFVGSLVAAAVLQRRSDLRRRLRSEERDLRRALAGADPDALETEVFERMVKASGATGFLCATSAQAFDRGVEALLGEPAGDLERADLVRTIHSLRKKLGLDVLRRGLPVSSTRALPADQPVLIARPGDRRGEGKVKGKILVSNEEAMTIRVDGPAPFAARSMESGKDVEVAFSNPLDASYTFRSRVAALRERGSTYLVIPHPSCLTRVQKRGFARAEIAEQVKFRWIPHRRIPEFVGSSDRLQSLIQEFRGVLTSLSGGGMRLKTRIQLERDDFIQIVLPFLPEPHDSESCFARVIRVRESGIYGLRFEGIGPKLQCAIIQHVRHEEARQIQKGRARETAGPRVEAREVKDMPPEPGGRAPPRAAG